LPKKARETMPLQVKKAQVMKAACLDIRNQYIFAVSLQRKLKINALSFLTSLGANALS